MTYRKAILSAALMAGIGFTTRRMRSPLPMSLLWAANRMARSVHRKHRSVSPRRSQSPHSWLKGSLITRHRTARAFSVLAAGTASGPTAPAALTYT